MIAGLNVTNDGGGGCVFASRFPKLSRPAAERPTTVQRDEKVQARVRF
jgi:hypothetical protein